MSATVRLAAAALAFAFSVVSHAQESKLELKDAPGRDKTMQCGACHSLDYIPMNSRFLDKAGWTASVNKMINAFGAPIPKEDVDAIASYLAENYGKPQPAAK
jgi:sulfite dehydrogenase (cytochrome) subunit B